MYEVSLIGPENEKTLTNWLEKWKKNLPKKRGSTTPPYFWDLDFPETTTYCMVKKYHQERVLMQQESRQEGEKGQSCGRLTSHRLTTLTQLS